MSPVPAQGRARASGRRAGVNSGVGSCVDARVLFSWPIAMPSSAFLLALRALLATTIGLWMPVAMAASMGESDARHLLARTGFGPTATEVRMYAALSRDDAIAKLLADVRTTPATPPPPWISESSPFRRPGPMASAEERKAFQQSETRRAAELRGW